MTKVLCLNPPFLDRFTRNSRSPAISKGGCVYYPIWLGYTTGALEKAGHEVILYDAPAAFKTIKDVLKVAKKFKPALTVVDTSTPSIYNDVKVLEAIKKELPETFAILVGPHVTGTAEETLRTSKLIDAVARSEYDFTIRELANLLGKKSKLTKADLKKVKGIAFLENNKYVQTEDRPKITAKELETEFPFVSEVYKKHLNIKDYFYPSVLYPEITIVTGRGCPFRCSFCFIPQVMNGHEFRFRSAKHLVDEFKWIKENLPEVKDIMIEDDTFTADRKRLFEIEREVKARGMDVTFTCNARADLNYEEVKALEGAGCREICVGFESGDQSVLNSIRKGTTVEKIRQFMKDVKKTDILVHGCFMLGNYGDTKETIRKTIDFSKEIDPDTAQFFPIMVYPGTFDFKRFQEEGWLTTKSWSEWLTKEGTHNTIVSRPGLSARELVMLCDKARKEFYLRPSFIAGKAKQCILHPKEIPRLALSTMTFMKYLIRGTNFETNSSVPSTS